MRHPLHDHVLGALDITCAGPRAGSAGIVAQISYETVPLHTKKRTAPRRRFQRCYSSVRESDFGAPREEVLDLYDQPYDARHPVICMDQKSKQLLAENRRLRSLGFRHEPPVPGLAIRLPVPGRAMVEENRRGWICAEAKREGPEVVLGIYASRGWLFMDFSPLMQVPYQVLLR